MSPPDPAQSILRSIPPRHSACRRPVALVRPRSWARRSKDPHRNETWPAPYAEAVRSCVSSAAAAPFGLPSPRTPIRQLHLPPLLRELSPREAATLGRSQSTGQALSFHTRLQ